VRGFIATFLYVKTLNLNMNYIAIILIIVIAVLIIELLKHKFSKNFFKYTIIALVILIILLVTSAYVDFGSFVGKESTFAKTGAAIVDTVSGKPGNDNTFTSISDKSKEMFNRIIDN
jgi:hypothetical protein